MKKNNPNTSHISRAFASIEIVVVVILIAIVALIIFYLQGSRMGTEAPDATTDPYMNGETVVSPSPVSESTEIDVLEEELEATVVGEFETDIDSMEEEASEL